MKKIYLDYAAATPMDKNVIKAMMPYFSDKFYNPSATYLNARDVRQDMAEHRSLVAVTLGARPAEIIFTSGATEANNLALAGVVSKFPKAKILVSALEHSSILEPAAGLRAQIIPANGNGIINIDKLKDSITDDVVLVSVMLVNNELGTIQPIKEIANLLTAVKKKRLKDGNKLPIYLHSDAAQAANYLDLHVSRLGVDMMSLNGGKIYGPKGFGILFIKAGTLLSSTILGGGQEFGLRSGTENLASIAGFTSALIQAQKNSHQESQRIIKLRQKLEAGISQNFSTATINGGNNRSPHILSVTFDSTDNETLMMQLDELGIECALGSACSASNDTPSSVLKAIGLSDKQARSTIRFSLGKYSTDAHIVKVIQALERLITS